MAAHRIPYTASISMAHSEDMMRKLKHALDARGFRFLHVLSPCPTGWKSEPAEGIELIRLAVDSGLYPVLEIVDGREWILNIEPAFSPEALKGFIQAQGRFSRSEVSIDEVRESILDTWNDLWTRVGRVPAAARDPAGRSAPALTRRPKQHPIAAE
jgi:pyruvate/2-oxoacid:ferredoxin oxidoreductase beta subunit